MDGIHGAVDPEWWEEYTAGQNAALVREYLARGEVTLRPEEALPAGLSPLHVRSVGAIRMYHPRHVAQVAS